MKLTLPFLIVFSLFIFSCDNHSAESAKGWTEDTEPVTLKGNRAALELPATFEFSSRQQLTTEVLSNKEHPVALALAQNLLQAFQFENAELSILTDKASPPGFLIAYAIDRAEVDKQLSAIVNGKINDRLEELKKRFSRLQVDKLTGNAKETGNRQALQYKYKITNRRNPKDQFYWTIFYLTTDLRTYVVHEVGNTEADIEKYLWNLKD